MIRAAVNELTRVIEVCDTNAPINEASGNTEQANLERATAEDCRLAIAQLNKLQ